MCISNDCSVYSLIELGCVNSNVNRSITNLNGNSVLTKCKNAVNNLDALGYSELLTAGTSTGNSKVLILCNNILHCNTVIDCGNCRCGVSNLLGSLATVVRAFEPVVSCIACFNHIVSKHSGFITNIVVTTSTSVSSITTCGTSRLGYNSLIAVSCSSGFITNIAVTASTSVSGITTCGTSRLGYNSLIAVSCSSGFITNIAVTASTSVSGITTLGTSRLGYNSFITVTKCLNCFVIGIATSTGINNRTCLGAGRIYHNRLIAVTGSCDFTSFFLVTLTNSVLYACLGTGSGGLNFPLTVYVSMLGLRLGNIKYITNTNSGDSKYNRQNNCKQFHYFFLL